jgi:MFS family permease
MLLWGGTSISYLAFNIFSLALPLIIYEEMKSTFAMITMRTIEFLPNLLLAIFIGVLTDRMNRKKLLLISLFIQMVCIFTIWILLKINSLSILTLYLIGLIDIMSRKWTQLIEIFFLALPR